MLLLGAIFASVLRRADLYLALVDNIFRYVDTADDVGLKDKLCRIFEVSLKFYLKFGQNFLFRPVVILHS